MRTAVPLGTYPLVLTLVLAACGQQGITPEIETPCSSSRSLRRPAPPEKKRR